MSTSDLILKTYREVTSSLELPYYVLSGVHGKIQENRILYSSPNIKDILGLTQIEIARNTQLFYDCIHPNYLEEYFSGNQQLQINGGKVKRFYLLKNCKTGTYSGIEEVATSRLNTDENRYEIYCTLHTIAANINPEEFNKKNALTTFSPPVTDKKEIVKKVLEGSSYLLSALQTHYKFFGCRFYLYHQQNKTLHIIADIQNKRYQQQLEDSVGVNVKTLIPQYHSENYMFELLSKGMPFITSEKNSISKLLKSHSTNYLLKKMSSFVVRFYNIKSFGVIPIKSNDGDVTALITFASGLNYSDTERKNIIDLIHTSAPSISSHFSEII